MRLLEHESSSTCLIFSKWERGYTGFDDKHGTSKIVVKWEYGRREPRDVGSSKAHFLEGTDADSLKVEKNSELADLGVQFQPRRRKESRTVVDYSVTAVV